MVQVQQANDGVDRSSSKWIHRTKDKTGHLSFPSITKAHENFWRTLAQGASTSTHKFIFCQHCIAHWLKIVFISTTTFIKSPNSRVFYVLNCPPFDDVAEVLHKFRYLFFIFWGVFIQLSWRIYVCRSALALSRRRLSIGRVPRQSSISQACLKLIAESYFCVIIVWKLWISVFKFYPNIERLRSWLTGIWYAPLLH